MASLFKTKGIVLKVKKQKDNEFLYQIFSYDFGKIYCVKKRNSKEKSLDIGFIASFEISSRENAKVHSIRSIRIISEFQSIGKDYQLVYNFLEMIADISKLLSDGIANFEIFSLYESLLNMKEINSEKILITRLKSRQIFGLLREDHPEEVTQKILKFLHKNSSQTCLRLKGIDEGIQQNLRQLCTSNNPHFL